MTHMHVHLHIHTHKHIHARKHIHVRIHAFIHAYIPSHSFYPILPYFLILAHFLTAHIFIPWFNLRSITPHIKHYIPLTTHYTTHIPLTTHTTLHTPHRATMSLMDAGVPLKNPVAGLSIGLITSGRLNEEYPLQVAGETSTVSVIWRRQRNKEY